MHPFPVLYSLLWLPSWSATLQEAKGHFRQGSRDQKPMEQFEAYWTLNWTLLHIKNPVFPKVQWVCLEASGSIQRSNIKNVWLTCERIRLTFGLFSLLLHGFKKFLFHFHFVHLERIGTTLSNNHLVRINKIDHVNSRIDKKKGESWCVLNNVLNS